MPFTFAHPAIVLPLKKKINKYFGLTALVLGSMSPDFEYFLNLKITSEVGHTLKGFLTYNLPLVFLFALVFHLVMKPVLYLHLPKFISGYLKIEHSGTKVYKIDGPWSWPLHLHF